MIVSATQFGPAVAVAAIMFPGVTNIENNFLEQNIKTQVYNYHTTNHISWSSQQIANTVTGKPGFVIAKVSKPTEYGHSDVTDNDDYITYE